MNKIILQSKVVARLDQNAAAIYLTSLNSESGRRTMKQALNVCAGLLGNDANAITFDWSQVRFQHVTAIRSKLTEVYKPASVNKMLAALRGVLRSAWQSGYMSAEDFHKAASVKGVKGETLPAGRELTSGEISALMAECEHDVTNAGARDAAIVGLMYSCGLRREEVVTLDLADYGTEDGRLVVRGKGNKERLAWITGGAARAMADWLTVRGEDPGALFVAVNKSGRMSSREHMTPKTIYTMLAKRATEAGVKSFSPHDMRRTFVSDLLDAGADITTVSRMAGHANVTTTSRYDRRPEDAKRKAASLLHVPYAGRA
ncbi:MAG: tyrosine-type recombinase/integrase [Anaerolineales bacterium]|nr:tyrosine-type recombinase/integrase [Anaerolineales bacterium]